MVETKAASITSSEERARLDDEAFHKDLSEVMAEVGYVQKTETNEYQDYKYAPASAVLAKVNTALSERDIVVGTCSELLHYDVTPKNVTKAVVRLTLAFMRGRHMLQVQGQGEGSDKGDKAVMKANTAALKYALASAFMISWGEDPEASASGEAALEEAPPKKTRKRPTKKREVLPEDPVADIEADIQAATAVGSLEDFVKPKILPLKESDPGAYKKLVKAYKAKQAELQGTEAA